MIFQLCIVIFIFSAVISESSDGKNKGPDISYKASLHVGGERAASIVDGEGGRRRQKRSAWTILDGTMRRNVVSAFNEQRSLVGASNMNYVDWDYDFEDAAINWTSGCNYDADFNSPFASYVIRAEYPTDYSSAQVVQGIFNLTDFYYAMRSTYVTGICAVKSSCSPIIVNGALKPQGYLYIIILPTASGFNDTVPQYALGPACSNCLANINWCYNNLCSENCDFNTTGCCQITASKAIGACVTPAPTTPAPTTLTKSASCCINTLKFEMVLLGLMSVLFAVIW